MKFLQEMAALCGKALMRRGAPAILAVAGLWFAAMLGADCQNLTPSQTFSFGAAISPGGYSLDGAEVWGALLDSGNPSGLMYGVTASGGANDSGAIFSVSSTGAETVLYSFSALDPTTQTNSDGARPMSALISDRKGGFFGTTEYGGAHGTGVIFHYLSSGQLRAVYTFHGVAGDGGPNATGARPNGLVFGTDGRIYGTTQQGGADGNGVVFAFDHVLDKLTVLHNFSPDNKTKQANGDGAWPNGTLAVGANGLLYGGTSIGGKQGFGVIYSISDTGVFTVLKMFHARISGTVHNADGMNCAGMTAGTDGNLYGACYGGGAGGSGLIFQLTTAGVYTVIHSFEDIGVESSTGLGLNDDGAQPSVPIMGADGYLYGTCSAGGVNGYGALYRISTDGTITTFLSLTAANGSSVEAPLALCANGAMYGSTALGGTNGDGSIFSIIP